MLRFKAQHIVISDAGSVGFTQSEHFIGCLTLA
jgi:hypothetical protein